MISGERSIQKVLMTADTVGGVWTYALDLCREFKNRGIQVYLATMGAPLSAAQWRDADQIGINVRESAYKLEWMDAPWNDMTLAGEWLLELEREINPDIIHLNGYAHANLQWNAPVLVVAHSCVLSWWQAVKNEPAPAEWNQYKQCVRQGLQAADAVIAISHSYTAEIERLYGPLDHVSVIYNGRDNDSFFTAEKKKQVFAMGRIWDEAKNLSVLGRLINPYCLPIFLAGDNRHPDTGAPVEIPNVTALGKLDAAGVRKYLAESYIYVLPAIYEPFGLSVLEAALSGCLLLLADIPTLRELWQETAFYFDPHRPETLDELLGYVLQHPEDCSKLTVQSTERAKLFSLKKMAESYLDLYDNLAGSLVSKHKKSA